MTQDRRGHHGRPHLDRARQIYKLWTEKDPSDSSLWQEELTERTVDWDSLDIRAIGKGGDIVYTSDKWEKPGVLERYHHPFDSGPSVFSAAHEGEAGAPASLARLLGVRDLRKVTLTLIAVVNEIVIKVPGSKNLTLSFEADPPALCSTLDKQGLVILSKERGPIVVRGGRMRVTARGIVG